MRTRIAIGFVIAGVLAAVGLSSRAENKDDPAALAKALHEASVSLEQGLKASEREGKPISGKYEMEYGGLQLSIYTTKDDKYYEVIIDHKSGTVKKSETITDADDLKDAKEQSQAMAKAKIPLNRAVEVTITANRGYRAVSVVPMLTNGKPVVAAITLMKGQEVKKVTAKLD